MNSLWNRRRAVGAAAAILVAPHLTRSASAAETVRFQLDWKFNAQFAGLFVAQGTGLYAKAGIAPTLLPWEDNVDVVSDVAAGKVEFGCAEQNLIIAAQARGAPVRAVATMFQASPYGLMTTPDRTLGSLQDLAGKRVGVHVDGVKVLALVSGVNKIPGIEVVEIPYGDKYERVRKGELHAVQCYVIDEPIGINAQYGAPPKVLKLSDYGFVSTAQTIVASEKLLADKPELVRAFLKATFDGWRATLADKPAAARLVVEQFVPAGSKYKDLAYQTETIQLLEPYVLGKGGLERIGVIDPEAWKSAARLMQEYGIVSTLPDLDRSLAQGFLG